MPLSVQRTSSARCGSVVDASVIAFWKHDSMITAYRWRLSVHRTEVIGIPFSLRSLYMPSIEPVLRERCGQDPDSNTWQ